MSDSTASRPPPQRQTIADLDGPEWASSDEEDNVPPPPSRQGSNKKNRDDGLGNSDEDAMSKTPKKKNQQQQQKKKKKNKTASKSQDEENKSSVIYVGHLPRGFEEGELRTFLSQFGGLHRLRLSRSKKTGKARGYAFVEMEEPQVASIVARTLEGYFLMEKRLVSHVVKEPPAELWDLPERWEKIPWQARFRQQLAAVQQRRQTHAGVRKRALEKQTERHVKKQRKLRKLGIDYEFPGWKTTQTKKATTATTATTTATTTTTVAVEKE